VDVAQDFGVYIVLIHHTGKGEGGAGGAVLAGRGASAIGAVASAVWHMEREKPRSLQRTLKVEGNMDPEAEHRFLVANAGREGYIDFWRPCAVSEGLDAASFFKPGESERAAGVLFERILGTAYTKASEAQKKRGMRIREQLLEESVLTERPGPRNSKLYALANSGAGGPFEGEEPEPDDLGEAAPRQEGQPALRLIGTPVSEGCDAPVLEPDPGVE
jgi:hypothetical protein